MFLQLAGLIITLIQGSDLHFGLPAVDIILVAQQACIYCVGVAFFHLVICRRSTLLKFANLMRSTGHHNNRNSQCPRKYCENVCSPTFTSLLEWFGCRFTSSHFSFRQG